MPAGLEELGRGAGKVADGKDSFGLPRKTEVIDLCRLQEMAPEHRFWLFLTERSERTWNHLQKILERMIEMTQPRFTARNIILGYGLHKMFILISEFFYFPLLQKQLLQCTIIDII